MEKATRQQLKKQNRDLVLKIFFETAQISRAEIARMTGLTRTTVSDIVADLIGEGLVNEVGIGISTGGKSPILLSLIEDAHTIIGLDLAYNQFRGAVVDLRGQIRQMVSLSVTDTTGPQAIEAAFGILDQLVGNAQRSLIGIGVGTPGLINSDEGVVVNAVNLEWKNLPLGKILGERYKLPVIVLNDCQAAAMGEFKFGVNTPSSQNMIVVRVGHGIGAGVIIDGKIFHGDGGSAGEIGHIIMNQNGNQMCRCGKIGCLETLASVRAVVQCAEARVRNGEKSILNTDSLPIDLDRLFDAYQAGDLLASEIIINAGQYLGGAIAILVSTLNIHNIILMGEMTRFGQSWLEVVYRTMMQSTLPHQGRDTRLHISTLPDNDVILGASALLAGNYSLLKKQPIPLH
jgi:N-acetylglucosamine repressor